jgi:microcystin-dependent protein
MTFKVENILQNVLSNKLNYKNITITIPLLQRYSALQIGDYKLSAGSSDINGWLVCDGRSLLISDYPQLFDMISTDFGTEDENHFNIPDYTSKVIGVFGHSASSSHLTQRYRGENIGNEIINLSVEQLPAHNHTGTTDTDGSHTHYINSIPYGIQTVAVAEEGGLSVCDKTTHLVSTNLAGTHTHNFTTHSTGDNNTIDMMQPTLFGASVMIFSKFLL